MYQQLNIWDYLQKETTQEEVEIEKVVNLKTSPISHYKCSLAYGDLTLIIAILRDYVKGFDKMLAEGDLPINEIEYEAFYRNKFLKIANKISEQIDYDYDKQLQKCLKKAQKADNSDVGEEALSLALKRGALKKAVPADSKDEKKLDELNQKNILEE